MQITKEKLITRKVDLEKQIQQLSANINVVVGMLEEVNNNLKTIDLPEEPVKSDTTE